MFRRLVLHRIHPLPDLDICFLLSLPAVSTMLLFLFRVASIYLMIVLLTGGEKRTTSEKHIKRPWTESYFENITSSRTEARPITLIRSKQDLAYFLEQFMK